MHDSLHANLESKPAGRILSSLNFLILIEMALITVFFPLQPVITIMYISISARLTLVVLLLYFRCTDEINIGKRHFFFIYFTVPFYFHQLMLNRIVKSCSKNYLGTEHYNLYGFRGFSVVAPMLDALPYLFNSF